jgi:hypothetical protein
MFNLRTTTVLSIVLTATVAPTTLSARPPAGTPQLTLLASGLQGSIGSTVGPGGDLYVGESSEGRVARVDPRTGEVST